MSEEMAQENNNAKAESKPIESVLNAMEARILGSLMEKQLSTPDAYPLSLNSLVLACNQKTSREPISNYSGSDLQRTLTSLQDRKMLDVDYTSRATRYAQKLNRVLGIDRRTQALLSILLLRGPQTLNELLTRTQRMHDFVSNEVLEEALEHLCAKTHPIVARIHKQPGQREDRYVHLLSGAPDLTAIAAMSSKVVAVHEHDDRVNAMEKQIQEQNSRIELLEKKIAVLLELNGVEERDI